MEAMVNITLKELEQLKKELVDEKQKNQELTNQKEIRVTIDGDMQDWTNRYERFFAYRIKAYGDIHEISPELNYIQFNEVLKEMFKKMLLESKPVTFYNKFPKWVHKWFKCEQK